MKKIMRSVLIFALLAAMLLTVTSCAKVRLYVQVDSINSGYEIVNIDANGNATGIPGANAPAVQDTTPVVQDTTPA